MPIGTSKSVCVNCKLRKKRCDKVRPRCGYCTRYVDARFNNDGNPYRCHRKNLDCQSSKGTEPDQLKCLPLITSPTIRSSLLLAETLSAVLQCAPNSLHSTVYLQILRIIRLSGQTIDDIVWRYFRGIHSFIPILSAPQFHDQLTHLAASPSAAFSVLLMSMALVTYHPNLGASGSALNEETFYITVKSVFAQTLASFPNSLHLLQAGIIIATHEYATRRISEALCTISICARMGYATDLHLVVQTELPGHLIQPSEKIITWMGVVILERSALEPYSLNLYLSSK